VLELKFDDEQLSRSGRLAKSHEGTQNSFDIMRMTTRILIADDHEMVRSCLRTLLVDAGWEVTGEAINGEQAVSLALDTKPCIALIDYQMPIMNGLEAVRNIRTKLPTTEVALFTMHDDLVLIARAFEAGARGYLTKTEINDHLLSAVEALASHRPYLSARTTARMAHSLEAGRNKVFAVHPCGDKVDGYTPGERVGLQLLRDQIADERIAALLGVSVKVVGQLRSRLNTYGHCSGGEARI